MATKVISSIWYPLKISCLSDRMIGIVAVQCKVTGKVKFYIGLGQGEDMEQDEEGIHKRGVPFYPAPLLNWFMEIVQTEKKDKKL